MLCLKFEAGGERYGLNSSDVVEILPLVNLRELPHAPSYIAGVFNFRGDIVPVVDISLLTSDTPSTRLMSTRIVLTSCSGSDGTQHYVGLLAERATQIRRILPEEIKRTGVEVPDAPWLGDIINDKSGMIQIVKANRLLPKAFMTSFFTADEQSDNGETGDNA